MIADELKANRPKMRRYGECGWHYDSTEIDVYISQVHDMLAGLVLARDDDRRQIADLTTLNDQRAKRIGQLRRACGKILRDRVDLTAKLQTVQEHQDGNVWYWQGDGDDHLESLTCPVVISAEDLRNLTAKLGRARPDALEEAMGVCREVTRAWMDEERIGQQFTMADIIAASDGCRERISQLRALSTDTGGER